MPMLSRRYAAARPVPGDPTWDERLRAARVRAWFMISSSARLPRVKL
jgi:hypothetical protein